MFILQGLPNVGPARAQALLDRFGSVAAVMAAGLEGPASVNGIGKAVAASILRSLEPQPAVEPQISVNRFPR